MAKSDFIESLKADKTALQNLKHMKAATNPSVQPDIADGDYVARLQDATCNSREFKIGNGKKKVPCVRFRLVIDRGAYQGTVLTKEYTLGVMSDKVTVTMQEILDRFATDMVRIGANEASLRDPEQLFDEIEAIGKEKPTLRIRCKKNPKGYIGIYFQGIVEDQPAPEDDDADEVEDSEDETDEVEDSEDAAEESSSGESVEVGNRVKYQSKGGRKLIWTVHSTDEDARTCTLRDATGKTVKGVSWDELEFTA